MEQEMTLNSENQVRVKSSGRLKNYFASAVIIICMLVGVALYAFVMGDPSNFEGGDPANHPLPGNILGIVYKGGFLVPIAMGILLILITFSIERLITLARASGKGSMDVFVQKVQLKLEDNDLDGAIAECDVQRGTVGNAVKECLKSYKKIEKSTTMNKEQKTTALQKSLEEATALELPMLEKHLTIIATIVSIATLIGLIGTVLGMIRAFSALATAGSPDAVALANGISEALINTALGITTSTIATVVYNYFTSRIDDMTYRIDEAGFSIVETFAEKHN